MQKIEKLERKIQLKHNMSFYFNKKNSGVVILVSVKLTKKMLKLQVLDDRIEVHINSVRYKGKANQVLIGFLSKAFSISKTKIHITHGHYATTKRILLELSEEVFLDKIKLLEGDDFK